MKYIMILPTISIKDAMKALNKSAEKCLVVIDKNQKLLGTLSDGDIRKSLLKGIILSNSIEQVYNSNCTYLTKNSFKQKDAKRIFIENKFDLIPVVDKNKLNL